MPRKKTILKQLNYLTPEEIKFVMEMIKHCKDGYESSIELFLKSNKLLSGLQGNNKHPYASMLYEFGNDKTVESQVEENEKHIQDCKEALAVCQSVATKFNQFEGIV